MPGIKPEEDKGENKDNAGYKNCQGEILPE
jgi:hypothetical protein